MKPNIFVSSTFYDLKYIREELKNFIKKYCFESVLFEEGDVGYTPGKALDVSCYRTISNSDMVILIIGGRYGSPSSKDKKRNDGIFEEYVSVTREEFRAGVNSGIPFFAFVERSVLAEYELYENNLDKFEKNKDYIKFRATSDVNVFKFIKEIKEIGNIPMTAFEKINDIEDFLAKQWSDMFKMYLNELREKKQTESFHTQVDKMEKMIEKVSNVLDLMVKTNSKPQESINKEIDEAEKKMRISMFVSLFGRRVKILLPNHVVKSETELVKYMKLSVEHFYELVERYTFDHSGKGPVYKERIKRLSLFGEMYQGLLKEDGMRLVAFPTDEYTLYEMVSLCEGIDKEEIIREMRENGLVLLQIFDM